MGLWRDPLDELIADLERALPEHSPGAAPGGLMSFSDFQKAVQLVLQATSEDAVRRLDSDPSFQHFKAQLRLLRKKTSESERC